MNSVGQFVNIKLERRIAYISPVFAVDKYFHNRSPVQRNIDIHKSVLCFNVESICNLSAVERESLIYKIGKRNLFASFNYFRVCSADFNAEIAEDIASYYAVSEQIPTVCALGVLIDTDLTVRAAGGYIIQLLPAAHGYEEVISKLENNIKSIKPITAFLDEGKSIEQIVRLALAGFEVEILEEQEVEYKCNCSRERFEKALKSLNKKELDEMAEEMEKAETVCRFCNSVYTFTRDELKSFAKNKKN